MLGDRLIRSDCKGRLRSIAACFSSPSSTDVVVHVETLDGRARVHMATSARQKQQPKGRQPGRAGGNRSRRCLGPVNHLSNDDAMRVPIRRPEREKRSVEKAGCERRSGEGGGGREKQRQGK
ncbi:hypothetical protein GWI33_015109 [Rhynchophorus ferrugineus]|uniref:Uncharacterized protein n=1 Tax=Rhynchophorus ferrugineus TaxID=354439 RepID=A0A834I3Y2_RHYFE|nr:hypothetical protein GWI33_015109 [Rhynchophorus ferrugineus]